MGVGRGGGDLISVKTLLPTKAVFGLRSLITARQLDIECKLYFACLQNYIALTDVYYFSSCPTNDMWYTAVMNISV